jgi:AcrR family transcriptional regulator
LADRIAAAAQAPGPPLDRIEAVVRAFFETFTEHPEVPGLMLRELASGRPLPPPVQQVVQRNIGAILHVVTEGQRDGSIRAGDPVLLSLSVVAQPFHFGIAGRVIAAGAGLDLRDPATRARIVDHAATTVRRALAADAAEKEKNS